MDYKDYLNIIISAAVCGGFDALAQMQLNINNFNFQRTGEVFLAGAIIGLVQHFRPKPGTVSVPKN